MRSEDLAAVVAIAGAVHPDFPEDAAVFAERLALFPVGCLVLDDGTDAVGYMVSHPWHLGAPPALDSRLGALPEVADTYYVHDVALLDRARGTGAASAGVRRLVDLADRLGLPSMSLVAVNGSAPFWERLGFLWEAGEGDAALAGKLAGYGADARYMVRRSTSGAVPA